MHPVMLSAIHFHIADDIHRPIRHYGSGCHQTEALKILFMDNYFKRLAVSVLVLLRVLTRYIRILTLCFQKRIRDCFKCPFADSHCAIPFELYIIIMRFVKSS